MVIGAVGTSIGNLCAKESDEKAYQVHNAILFINTWIGAFCVICLFNLLNPFISLWIGDEYLFPKSTVLAIVISFYIQVTMRTGEMFKSASGLFWNDRYAPIAQCLLNIVVSILLVKKYEITGIFIGTTIAMILTKWWVTPYVVYKHKFKKSVRLYFAKYFWFTAIAAVAFIVTTYAVTFVPGNTWIAFIGKVIVSAITPNVLFLVAFFKTEEFKYCLNLIFKRRQIK